MTAPSEERPPAGQTPYLLDTETLTEMNRLLSLDGIFTRSMGGPLPEQEDLSHVTRVLDLACGPGGWALLVAERYPQMQVMGIDISPQMIGYARERARAQSLANASFQVMNILQPLAF